MGAENNDEDADTDISTKIGQITLELTRQESMGVDTEHAIFQLTGALKRLKAENNDENADTDIGTKIDQITLELTRQESIAVDTEHAIFQLAGALKLLKAEDSENRELSSYWHPIDDANTDINTKVDQITLELTRQEFIAVDQEHRVFQLMRALTGLKEDIDNIQQGFGSVWQFLDDTENIGDNKA